MHGLIECEDLEGEESGMNARPGGEGGGLTLESEGLVVSPST